MQAQCSFCRFCVDDSNGNEKRYIGDGKKHSWECVDTTACAQRVKQNKEN